MRLCGDHPAGRTAIVALPAEIDVNNSDEVFRQLSTALRSGVELLIADFSETIYCDVSAIRAIVRALDQTDGTGAELRLVVPPGPVRRLLDLIRLDGRLPVYASPGQAGAAGTGQASAALGGERESR
ncbi:MAG: STAS domain-containing protein [Actinobacteria bacterium]|nr:STAS domain-containing protein [Actinomycetota bacterium]